MRTVQTIQVKRPGGPTSSGRRKPRRSALPDLVGSQWRENQQDSLRSHPPWAARPVSPGFNGADPGSRPERSPPNSDRSTRARFRVINPDFALPTSQQVLLKVRVAELNRTPSARSGPTSWHRSPSSRTLFGSQIAGNGFTGSPGQQYLRQRPGAWGWVRMRRSFGTFFRAASSTRSSKTRSGRNKHGSRSLAEPNLIAPQRLSGQLPGRAASFPDPLVPRGWARGHPLGGGTLRAPKFKQFGRQPGLPAAHSGRRYNPPERFDPEGQLGSTSPSVRRLCQAARFVPGLNTRNAHTTVELQARRKPWRSPGLLLADPRRAKTQKLPGPWATLPYHRGLLQPTPPTTGSRRKLVVTNQRLLHRRNRWPLVRCPPDLAKKVVEPNDPRVLLPATDRRTQPASTNGPRPLMTIPLHLIRHSIVEKKYPDRPLGVLEMTAWTGGDVGPF